MKKSSRKPSSRKPRRKSSRKPTSHKPRRKSSRKPTSRKPRRKSSRKPTSHKPIDNINTQPVSLKKFFEKVFNEVGHKVTLTKIDEEKIKYYIGKIISKILNSKPNTLDKILLESLGKELAEHSLRYTKINATLRDYLQTVIGTRKLKLYYPEIERSVLVSSHESSRILTPFVEYLLAEIFSLAGHWKWESETIMKEKISITNAMEESIRRDTDLSLLLS